MTVRASASLPALASLRMIGTGSFSRTSETDNTEEKTLRPLPEEDYRLIVITQQFEILKRLEALPGKHLVIVRYSTGNTGTGEWVYNYADIDSTKVVWAREIPGVEIEPLLRCFSSYHIGPLDRM